MQKDILLSDGLPCSVRVLGLFELDRVALDEMPGPFIYEYTTVTGEKVEQIINPNDYMIPPEKPDRPRYEAQKGTQLWEAWLDFDIYHAAVAHDAKQGSIAVEYASRVANYIMANCLSDADQERILDKDDWKKVYHAAMAPTVTMEDIAAALRRTFQGII